MRILTLWQPWASLVVCGAKVFETRSWRTPYRGSVLIHAAKKDPREVLRDCQELVQSMHRALWAAGVLTTYGTWMLQALRDLPRGVVLGEVTLLGCLAADGADVQRIAGSQEGQFGDFGPGRWAWHFARARIPWGGGVACRGRQGLARVRDPELEKAASYYRAVNRAQP